MKKLRIGIMGAGQESLHSHFPNCLKNKELAEIAAVCDVNLENAKKAAQQFQVPAYYESHKEMLEKEELDLVTICVPNRFHEPLTVDALRAGCHVLCEKPPALTAVQAERMAMEARKAGKILTYNLHYRYAPEVQMMKKMIDGGEFGTLYTGKVQAVRRRGIPGWGNFTNKAMQGGGPLVDIGVHMLDTALYLLDYPWPVYVAASSSDRIGKRGGAGLMGSWDPEKFTVEDGLFGFIQFEGGISLQIEAAFALNCKEKQKMNVEIFGDLAGASVFQGEIYGEKNENLTDTKLPFVQEIDKRNISISNFIRCCAENDQPLITAEQGVTLMRIIEALYRSAETGKVVEL